RRRARSHGQMTTIFSSLRSRIFLTSALLAVLSIAIAIYLVNVRVTREAESSLQREIVATGILVDQLRTTQTETFTTMARLKAAVFTKDRQTVQDTVEDLRSELKLTSNLFMVTNPQGSALAIVGASPRVADVVANQPGIRDALGGHESVSLLPQVNGMLQL